MIGATAMAVTSGRACLGWLLLLTWVGVSLVQNFAAVAPQTNLHGWNGGRYFLCGSVCLCLLLALATAAQLSPRLHRTALTDHHCWRD